MSDASLIYRTDIIHSETFIPNELGSMLKIGFPNTLIVWYWNFLYAKKKSTFVGRYVGWLTTPSPTTLDFWYLESETERKSLFLQFLLTKDYDKLVSLLINKGKMVFTWVDLKLFETPCTNGNIT